MAGFLKTKRGKNTLNFFYGIGASIVILGAWMKLLHLPGANTALTIGLLTECVIFALTAFDFPDPSYDWSLVYPELAGGDSLSDKRSKVRSASQQLDQMLEKAKMGPELIDGLKTGFERLNSNVQGLADLSDASSVTDEYSVKVKAAADSVGSLSEAASRAVSSVQGLAVDDELSSSYHSQIQSLVSNLSALNDAYAREQEHSGTMHRFYESLAASADALSSSVDDARRYKDEMARLQQNLASLNNIYGNMLSAMAPGGGSNV